MLEVLQTAFTWLADNQAGVVALSSIILALTTIVYAWHTSVLAKENKLLRQAGSAPEVIAFLSPNARHASALEFVISNIGRGPAFNIAYKIVSGGEDFGPKGVKIQDSEVPMSVLPQGEQVRRFLGTMAWDLLKEPALAPFEIQGWAIRTQNAVLIGRRFV